MPEVKQAKGSWKGGKGRGQDHTADSPQLDASKGGGSKRAAATADENAKSMSRKKKKARH